MRPIERVREQKALMYRNQWAEAKHRLEMNALQQREDMRISWGELSEQFPVTPVPPKSLFQKFKEMFK